MTVAAADAEMAVAFVPVVSAHLSGHLGMIALFYRGKLRVVLSDPPLVVGTCVVSNASFSVVGEAGVTVIARVAGASHFAYTYLEVGFNACLQLDNGRKLP